MSSAERPAVASERSAGATAALVGAEPLLPALRTMLDDQALGDWLGDRLGHPVAVRRHYLRLKPGTSVVLAAETVTADGPRQLLVQAYSPGGAPKLEKNVERTAPGALVAVDRDLRMTALVPSGDRDLPALAATAGALGRAQVLERVLGTPLDPASLAITPLSYNPHRRWVGAVSTAGGRLLMRAYRPERLGAALRPLTALAGADDVAPRVLGRHRRLGLVVLEHVPGDLPDRGSVPDLTAAGQALARLHETPATLRPVRDRAEPGVTRDSVEQVARLLPYEAWRIRALDRAVRDRLAARPHRSEHAVAVHGDFSLDQVVCADGTARLIDFDRAGSGPAARDLGGLLAAELAGTAGTAPDRARRVLDAVLAGYAEVRDVPDEVTLVDHALDRLLDRAAEPFRHVRADWAERTTALLDVIESLLRDGRVEPARRPE